MKIIALRCCEHENPVAVKRSEVHFSWKLESDRNDEKQAAYQLLVSKNGETVWDSGRVDSDDTRLISYEGPDLEAGSGYEWQVTSWNQAGELCASAVQTFETESDPATWNAKWIGLDDRGMEPFDRSKPFFVADDYNKGVNDYYLPPVPYFRKTIRIEKEVQSAKVYFSAFGLIHLYANGQPVGDDLFVPGCMDYPKRVYYRAYHMEELLRAGENVLSAELADGWFSGYMGLNNREWYGSKPRFMVWMEITYTDGTVETVGSDETWKASFGKIREADLFEGEAWDPSLEPEGWKEPGFFDDDWKPVDTGSEYPLLPEYYPGLPVVVHGEVKPSEIKKAGENRYLVLFDKYICGILKVKMKGEAQSSITMRFAELLEEDDQLWLAGNRSARNQDHYILKGDGEEVFAPIFTYHGFRVASIEVEGNLEILEVTGVQIGSELREATEFACSDDTVNQIFEMIHATEKANLFSVPTDCTARDERLGWGMEGNHFLRAMSYLHDLSAFIEKWTVDIFDGQKPTGGLEAIAPPLVMKDVEQYIGDLQSNHGLMMVHTLYRMYGRTDVVSKYYDQLVRYFDYMDRNSDRNLRNATSCDWLGIWESTGHSDTDHGYGECNPSIIGTAHYGMAARMMTELAEALGKAEDAEKYRSLYRDIKKAFNQNFVRRDGTLRQGKQGEYLIGLAAGFFPDEEKVLAVFLEKLLEKGYVRWYGGTPTTPYFLSTLKKYGKEEIANRFLVSRRYPSLGYMLSRGFDTTWERWDAIHEDGSIHPQPMNAICHEGLAVVGDYLIYGLAGIECLAPGFRKIRICPGLSSEITSCSAKYDSTYGPISVDWSWSEGSLATCFSIPANTDAVVELPCDEDAVSEITGIDPGLVRYENGRAVFATGSGTYRICTRVDLA